MIYQLRVKWHSLGSLILLSLVYGIKDNWTKLEHVKINEGVSIL